MTRKFNFSAGPGILPESVLKEVAENLFDYKGTGMSLIEMSHRGAIFTQIIEETKASIRELLKVPETHDILLLQGGGHLQFSMVPLNFLGAAAEASYIVNGVWSKKASVEAARYCHVNTVGVKSYGAVPDQADIDVPRDAAYLYYCMNETVDGLEFNYIPDAPSCVPLVADVSSDFLSRPIDFKRHAVVYAGAQKNFGPAGLVVAIVRKDLYGMTSEDCPTMLNYSVHAKAGSMYNTPPTFAIWVASLVCRWIKEQGGVEAMDKLARERSSLVYDCIDSSNGFYINNIPADARSRMNVVFNIKDPALVDEFISGAAERNLVNLKGHRLVGGLRASLYNAMPIEGARALVAYMNEFAAKHA